MLPSTIVTASVQFSLFSFFIKKPLAFWQLLGVDQVYAAAVLVVIAYPSFNQAFIRFPENYYFVGLVPASYLISGSLISSYLKFNPVTINTPGRASLSILAIFIFLCSIAYAVVRTQDLFGASFYSVEANNYLFSYQALSDNIIFSLFFFLFTLKDRLSFQDSILMLLVFLLFISIGLASSSSALLIQGCTLLIFQVLPNRHGLYLVKLLTKPLLLLLLPLVSLLPFAFALFMPILMSTNLDSAKTLVSILSRFDLYACTAVGFSIYGDPGLMSCNGTYLHSIWSILYEYPAFSLIILPLIILGFWLAIRYLPLSPLQRLIIILLFMQSLFSKHWDWPGNFLVLGLTLCKFPSFLKQWKI
jgi:hypothetical protein